MAVVKPGDTIMGMSLPARRPPLPRRGGQPQRRRSGSAVHYGVDPATGRIDYDVVREQAKREQPKLIIAGGSAYARIIDFAAFRSIADEVGALFLVDMAHFAGLVAGGVYPSPVPHAQVVTSTTHKTLRGPRAGLILCDRRARQGDRQVGVPRHAGRPAGARDRGQGGRLRRGADRRLQASTPARWWTTPRRWRRRWSSAASPSCPAAPTPT